MNFLQISSIAVAAILAGMAIFYVVRKIHQKYLIKSLKLRLLLVKLHKKSPTNNEKEWVNEINAFSQLAGILANSKIPCSFETAVNYIGEEICFYTAIPRDSAQFAIRQIQGLWPDAHVEETDDYNIFNSKGATLGAYLKLKQSAVLPLRTYEEAGLDTFMPILSNLSKIEAVGEGVAIQVIIKLTPSVFRKNALNIISRLKKGENFEHIFGGPKLIAISDIQEAFKTKKKEDEKREIIVDQEMIKTIEKKLAKPVFSVNVRLMASAPSQFRAEEILNSVAGSFDQFSSPLKNSASVVKPKNLNNLIFKYIFRQFDESQTMILGADELASIFHFPTSATEIPKIKWIKSREAAPSSDLPKQGILIGNSAFRGEKKPVFVSDEDRRRHIYIIGQTGTGKSNLLTNMVIEDIQAGKGMGIIDPHGDLINEILELIPEKRKNDVIIFDPADLMKPIGLNMLENDPARPEEKTFIVNEMQSIFNKLFSQETMGPMFEQYMRNALLLLMEDAPYESPLLTNVPRVFTDAAYREEKLKRCQNPAVKDFWGREAVMAGGEASLQNITPYITSKFNNFIANDYVRPIINQPKSAFKFREVMDEGKILLVNLSKGKIGEINAALLGMIIVGKLLMAALSRVDLPQEKRRDFYLYIDEFQNFTTDSIAVILSEARKYRLNLTIAHQFIAQLEEKIRDSVFGNAGSIVAFRVGPDDAEFLEKQFTPVFTKEDLINIDNFNAYAKLLINGQTSKPFNIKTILSPRGNPAVRDEIKELSRNKYGTDRMKK